MSRKGFAYLGILITVIAIGVSAAIGIPKLADSIEKEKGPKRRIGLTHRVRAQRVGNRGFIGVVEVR